MGSIYAVFFEDLGTVFLIFAALETGLKIDGFSAGTRIQRKWSAEGKSHKNSGRVNSLTADGGTAESRIDDCLLRSSVFDFRSRGAPTRWASGFV